MLYSLLTFAYLIRTIRNIFYHLYWWEKKEYRTDRMLVHLRETHQGKKWLLGPISIVKWILLSFSFIGGVIYLIYAVYIFEAIKNILELRYGWRQPPLKSRVISIFLITLLSLLLIFLYLSNKRLSFAMTLLIADKLLGPSIALLILLSNSVFNIYKIIKISEARKQILASKNLKVIGVTGSYGKTTTKELIAQILAQKYKVLKTQGSQNTDIGVAERILSTDLTRYDYFICEMAAYKRGEITAICNMLRGKIEIGVITGINEQHQSLFGSIENTKKAKFELIEAVNKNGTAIFNTRSKYINEMIYWAKQKKLKVLELKNGVELPLQIQGEHFRENLSLAITVAKIVEMSKVEIKKAIEKLELPAKVMNITKKAGVLLIDNTFNSNPDGVYAALSYLENLKGTKIIVLQPLIELGKYTREVHKKIGQMADKICNKIVLTNKNFYDFIKEGIENESKISVRQMPKISNGAILFQGKEAEKYLAQTKLE